MSRYEVYQNNYISPLTIVKAERYYFDGGDIIFCNQKDYDVVAMFNWHNIAGFKKVEEYKMNQVKMCRPCAEKLKADGKAVIHISIKGKGICEEYHRSRFLYCCERIKED